MQKSANDEDRLHRLLDALDKVRAMNGSPDIINSILKAIEDVQTPNH